MPQYSFQNLPCKQCQLTPKCQTTQERRRWSRHLCTQENVVVTCYSIQEASHVLGYLVAGATPQCSCRLAPSRVYLSLNSEEQNLMPHLLGLPNRPSIPARRSPVSTDTERSAFVSLRLKRVPAKNPKTNRNRRIIMLNCNRNGYR